jgi:phage host-nuclease inhibitor protein Gam
MSKNRIKLQAPVVPVPASRIEAEVLVGTIAGLKIEERASQNDMDARLKAIRDEYESTLGALASAIAPCMDALASWAAAHPTEFGDKRSIDMTHGIVGWRQNPPSVKPLKGFTWAAVLGRLKELGRLDFLRMKEEVNKEALLGARLDLGDGIRGFYCQVVQEDEFYLEPKIAEQAAREVAS